MGGLGTTDTVVPELIEAGYIPEHYSSYYVRDAAERSPGSEQDNPEKVPGVAFNMMMLAAAFCRPASLQALIDAGKLNCLLLSRASYQSALLVCFSAQTMFLRQLHI